MISRSIFVPLAILGGAVLVLAGTALVVHDPAAAEDPLPTTPVPTVPERIEPAGGALPLGVLLSQLPVPERATLCGQPIPLDRPEIREALAYELVLTIGRPTMPLLWFRRAPSVLPIIEPQLRAAGVPDDLKYLAMIESDLRWTTRSPAGALGLWQFIAGTATRYGLRVDKVVDERLDPDRATEAAIRYLKDLEAEFGDWFLAMAAYNSGENRVRGAIRENGGPAPYFELFLPYETRRYVFRALAAKLVFENPEAYGLAPMSPLFVPEFGREVVEDKLGTISLRGLATRLGVGYAALRTANPHLLQGELPKGRYQVRVPRKGTAVGVEGDP